MYYLKAYYFIYNNFISLYIGTSFIVFFSINFNNLIATKAAN
jgi:hypothetical protein